MSELGGTYETGTISVVNGSVTVAGTGVVWADVIEGDWLYQNGVVGIIEEVTGVNFNSITLKKGWAGTTAASAPYIIIKNSWLRYEPALTQQKVRELLLTLAGVGFFYFVEGSAPDPEAGEDGQFAIKINDPASPWLVWYKIDGVWVQQGSPVGLNFRSDVNDGDWSSVATYYQRDIVRDDGKLWYAKRTNVNKDPSDQPTNAADWAFFYPFPTEAGVTITLDSMESEIAIGPVDGPTITADCVLRKVTVRGDGIGDIQLDIRKKQFDDGPPEAGDSICGSTKPALVDQRDYSDDELYGWDTSFSIGDALTVNVDSCSGLTRVVLTLYFDRIWSNV